MPLSKQQQDRYGRNIMLGEIGEEGQERLLAARVLVIGAGGLGSPVLLYLAAAGVGRLGIMDSDTVELSNLQRQITHFTNDISRPKVASAAEKLSLLNPDVVLDSYPCRFDSANAESLVSAYDVVLDCTDNFASKFLINDICVQTLTPYVHGGILRFDGQLMTVKPGESACYRCVFDRPPEGEAEIRCARDGVMGVLPGVIGSLMATEAMKLILGAGQLLTSRLLTYDALSMRFRELALHKNPSCPACADHQRSE